MFGSKHSSSPKSVEGLYWTGMTYLLPPETLGVGEPPNPPTSTHTHLSIRPAYSDPA